MDRVRLSARRARRRAFVIAAVLAFLALIPAACSQTSASDTGSTNASESTLQTPGTTTTQLPPAYVTPESNAYARELKRTSYAVAQLGDELSQAGAPPNDPRVATIYALRARGQAITAAKAVLEKQFELADGAARELRSHLSRAQAIAEGPTAESVTQAMADLEGMSVPSVDPQAAGKVLDVIIADLQPLMPPEATSTTGP